MKLKYYKGEQPNFGDELNTWLWPQLLPHFFDDDPGVVFIGIGSIIGTHYEPDARKIVFGTGFVPAYGFQAPNVHREDWDVFFVRGPRTAHCLGLPKSSGIGDSALLLRALNVPFDRDPRYIGFMPHWKSMPRGDWPAVCETTGIRLLDPRAPVEQVVTEILGCKLLIAEAMHGAIVADALRVPWVPVLPIEISNRDKWFDWAEALNLKLEPHRLWPSTPAELKFVCPSFLSGLTKGLAGESVSRLTRPLLSYVAAQRLSVLAKVAPCLSADGVIENAVEQMLAKLRKLEKNYRN